jgi:hypothetical protein
MFCSTVVSYPMCKPLNKAGEDPRSPGNPPDQSIPRNSDAKPYGSECHTTAVDSRSCLQVTSTGVSGLSPRFSRCLLSTDRH